MIGELGKGVINPKHTKNQVMEQLFFRGRFWQAPDNPLFLEVFWTVWYEHDRHELLWVPALGYLMSLCARCKFSCHCWMKVHNLSAQIYSFSWQVINSKGCLIQLHTSLTLTRDICQAITIWTIAAYEVHISYYSILSLPVLKKFHNIFFPHLTYYS